MLLFLLFFLTDLPAWGYVEKPVILTDEQYHYPLGFHLAFLEDTTRTLTIDDVTASQYADRFMPGSEEVPNFGIGPVVYWIRIPMKNETRHINDWRLRIESSYLDFIEVYIPTNMDTQASPFTVRRSGDSIPFHEWDTPHRQFVFKIFLQPHTEQTLYVRIENADGIITRMSVWSAEAFAEQISREQLWYGFYFGSLCIMACYNLFIFLSLRDKSYLCYVLFVLSWGLNEFCAEGFAYQYLWPNSPQWNEPVSVLFGTLSAFFGLRFTAHFLKLPTLHPKLNRVVTILSAGWFVAFGATCIADLGMTNVFIQLLTLGAIAIIVIAPITSWRHGYRPARYLLLAWSTFAITGTTSTLASLGILPANAILLYSYPIGVILLMLLLSWALADRINELKTQAEQKRLRTLELQQAKNLAEAANQAKSMFLANMSHELRTPLNSILGYAQILGHQRDMSATTLKDGLAVIYQSGTHLLTLINDILDISKIEARKMELCPAEINLCNFLDGIVGIIQIRARQKDICFVCEFDNALPTGIETDEKRLRQVLLNLLGNAVKFTDTGGNVTFQVTRVEHDNLQFSISDTGIGMTPEQVTKIFDPFEQVGEARQQVEGTGLGLAISRQLAELMGGQLQVASTFGNGSTFRFEAAFPVTATPLIEKPARKGNITGYTPLNFSRRKSAFKVLVVDDKPGNRLVLLNLLELVGFEVTLAENGQDGVDKACAIQPDIILMDLVMPVMNGFEAVKQIRQIPNLKETPILVVSANAYEMDQEQSLKLDCQGFLPKPVDTQQLFDFLETRLHLKWTYEADPVDEAELCLPISEAELVPPPQKELEALYELAMFGSMNLIRERACYLETLDEQYRPFAVTLRHLAREIEDRQILTLIEQFMEHES